MVSHDWELYKRVVFKKVLKIDLVHEIPDVFTPLFCISAHSNAL